MELMGWATAAAASGIPQASMAASSASSAAAAAMSQGASPASLLSNNLMQQLQAGQQQRLDAATQLASLHPQQHTLQQQQQSASNTQSLQEQFQQLQQLQQAQLLHQQHQQQQLMNISHSSAGSADAANAQIGNSQSNNNMAASFLDPNHQSSETLLLQLQLQQLRQQHQSLMAQQQQARTQRASAPNTAAGRSAAARLEGAGSSSSINALPMQSSSNVSATTPSSPFLTPAASASAISSQALMVANNTSPATGFLGKIPPQNFPTTMEGLQQQLQQQQQSGIGRPDPSVSFSNQNSVGFFDAWTSSAIPTQLMPGGAPAAQDTPASILKPLSAYNYFFTEERERLLQPDKKRGEETDEARKMRLLSVHWSKDRNKRRPHRKTHGKISFTTLSKHIGQAWRELSDAEKTFYKNVAKADMARYKEELAKRDQEIAKEASLKSDQDG